MQKIKHVLWYPRRNKKFGVILLIVLIILAVVFWPRPPEELPTQKAERGDITQSISTTGSIVAKNSVSLSFTAGGKLTYLGIKEGDTVKAGQLIATVDPRTAQKNLENSLQQYLVERNTFEQGREDNNAPTPDDAVSDDIKYQLLTNQYNLNSSVIQVELQALAKEQSFLISPINGIVTDMDVTSNGVNVSPTNKFDIADPSSLVFKIEVDESDVGNVKVSDPVDVNLDAYPDKTLNLSVDSIDFNSQTSDTGGTVFNVDAALPSDGIDYRLGMNGDAEIIVKKMQDVIIISLASLTDDNAVYVKEGDTFRKQKVKIGIQSDTEVEILNGLDEGDEVALQPDKVAEQLKNTKKNFFFF